MSRHDTSSESCAICGGPHPTWSCTVEEKRLALKKRLEKPAEAKRTSFKKERLDLSKAIDTQAEFDLFKQYLEKRGLLGEAYLYSGFDASKLPQLERTGSYADDESTVWCFRHDQMTDWGNSPVMYAAAVENPAIGIFNADCYERDMSQDAVGGTTYKLKAGKTAKDAVHLIIRPKLF